MQSERLCLNKLFITIATVETLRHDQNSLSCLMAALVILVSRLVGHTNHGKNGWLFKANGSSYEFIRYFSYIFK